MSNSPFRRCEPTDPREARPDDRLREAIQSHAKILDCFVASLLAMTANTFAFAALSRPGDRVTALLD
jgi:hypothetical protein